MSSNPLAQFEIHKIFSLPDIFGFNIDFTNAALYMSLSTLFSIALLTLGLTKISIVPKTKQIVVEMVYKAICNTIESSTGNGGLQYRGIISSIFLFILSCNLVGMLPIPHAFTPTSHIAVTFALSLFVFVWCTFTALQKQGLGFFRVFLPKGTPWWLAPMMVMVEVFAYFARPVSLAIRLAANMIAGHTILKVIASFVLSGNVIFAIFPFIFVSMLIVFEIFIAILQAYIFMMLTCVYLNDALTSH